MARPVVIVESRIPQWRSGEGVEGRAARPVWHVLAGRADVPAEHQRVDAPCLSIDGPDGGPGVYTVAIAWRGMTKLSDPGSDACGSGSGKYDALGGAELDVYRRVLVMQVYITEPI